LARGKRAAEGAATQLPPFRTGGLPFDTARPDQNVGRCTAPSLSNNATFGDASIVFYVGGNTDSSPSSNFILFLQTSAANSDGGTLLQ
jgi:hypothetical protein